MIVRSVSRAVPMMIAFSLLLVFGTRLLGAALPVSPQLAFAVHEAERPADVYVVDLGRGLTVRLAADVADRALSFAPDGTLVFSRAMSSGQSAIFLLDSAGNEVRLSPENAQDWYPAWSPNGAHIAFLAYDANAGFYAVHVMNCHGGERRNLSLFTDLNHNALVWLADSIQIMYSGVGTGQSATYLFNSLSGRVFNFTDSAGIRGIPAWSPDSRHIAYVRYSSMYASIYISEVSAAGAIVAGTTRELTSNRAFNTNPLWSPDGSEIAFVMDNAGYPEIYVMDADGRNVTNVSHNPRSTDVIPVWSRDGSMLAFTSTRTGSPQLYVMNADGTQPRQVTHYQGTGALSAPTWLP